ncbi:MAG: choice-of-anchor Q domain-containing protein [Nonlabens sp.]
MKNRKLLYALLMFLITLGYNLNAQVVTSTADDGTQGTLRVEINDALANPLANNTITFDPSLSGQFIILTQGQIDIDAGILGNLTITGDSNNPVTVDGSAANRIFNITSTIVGTVTINDLNLSNGSATSGGAIQVSGATTVLNLNGMSVSFNEATGTAATDGGGALFNDGATVNISNGTMENNTAVNGSGSGGAVLNSNGGTLNIDGTTFSSNISNRAGGAIEDNSGAGGNLLVSNASFSGCFTGPSPGNGGAIHLTGTGDSTITSSTFSSNGADAEGGALWNGSGTMIIDSSTIDFNTASGNASDQGGGGVFNNGGTLTIRNNTAISNNTAGGIAGSGGGILSVDAGTDVGSFTIINSSITGNSANRAGGGIEINTSTATNTITDTNIDGNLAGADTTGPTTDASPGNGGGLHVTGPADVSITNGSTNNNAAGFEGGGLWIGSGVLSLEGTLTVNSNIAYGTAAASAANPGEVGGGGVFANGGDVAISGSVTINSNRATGATSTGGAILMDQGGDLVINGATINSNQSNRAGGAIESNSGGFVDLTNVTINSNSTGVVTGPAAPGNGGGLHISGNGDVSVVGGTVVGNTAASEGGGLWNGAGTMSITGTLVNANTASGDSADQGGGGIYALSGGTVNIFNGTQVNDNIADGTAGSGGGILVDVDASLTVDGALINSNRSNRAGGGIEVVAGNQTATISLNNVNMISNNTGVAPATAAPGNGGAIHITGNQDISITGSTINSNQAGREGGGLWNGSGTMTIDNSTINGNTAIGEATGGPNPGDVGGGGIFNNGGDLVIQNNSTIAANIATGSTSTGGGILSEGGTVSIADSDINSNESNRAGGGIEINSDAPLAMTNVALNNNRTGVVTGMSAPGNGGGIHITGASTIDITGGTINSNTAASEGGGLWNGTGTMTIDNVVMNANIASGDDANTGGGAIYALSNGTVIIQNNTAITNNIADGTAGSGGGILVDADASLDVSNTIITGNQSNRAGGGIEIVAGSQTATINLDNVILSNNNTGIAPAVAAPGNGGGLHITGNQDIMITNSTVNGNQAASEGGGLWNGAGIMALNNVSVTNNTASGDAADNGGGGIFNVAGNMDITGSDVQDNIASGISGSGGGILSVAGDVSIDNSSIERNGANRAGGGIEIIDGTLTIINTNLNDNDCNTLAGTANPGNGGGLHISGAATTNINSSNIDNNVAGREGGGVWNQSNSTMTLTEVIMDGNTANGTDPVTDGGGGVFVNGGTVNINSSTISNNNAPFGSGGGVAVLVGDIQVTTSTISGNSAGADGGGVGIAGTGLINASTIALNSAGNEAGGVGYGATTGRLALKNTIVAANTATAGFDNLGANNQLIQSDGFNLIAVGEGGTEFNALTSDIVGTVASPADPALDPVLQDNGGPTPTHAITNGSEAYNTGDPADTFSDQRGESVFGGRRDIGAYEAQMVLSIEIPGQLLAGIKMFPNPTTNGELNIEIPAGVEELSYNLFDMSGKQIIEGKLNTGLNQINLPTLSTGIYLMNLATGNETQSLRLMVK